MTLGHPEDCNIPVEIADGECIIRAICSPYHYKNATLLPKAFDPPYERDDVSVMRGEYLSPHTCKEKGKALRNPAVKKEYVGLVVLRAQSIREAGAEVVDSRHIYCGHADILHGERFKFPREEPADSPLRYELRERNKALVEASIVHLDPDPTGVGWNGAPLEPKA